MVYGPKGQESIAQVARMLRMHGRPSLKGRACTVKTSQRIRYVIVRK
jgi:hypothetical protein